MSRDELIIMLLLVNEKGHIRAKCDRPLFSQSTDFQAS